MRVIRIVVAVGAVASAIWALSLRNTNPEPRLLRHRHPRLRAPRRRVPRARSRDSSTTATRIPARDARRSPSPPSPRSSSSRRRGSHLDAIERGIAVTITTCVLIIAIEATDRRRRQTRCCRTPTVVYLGKISYGTYLWHWLVILVVTAHLPPQHPLHHRASPRSSRPRSHHSATNSSNTPSALSRLLDRHRRTVIATGLTISVVSALILIPNIVDPATSRHTHHHRHHHRLHPGPHPDSTAQARDKRVVPFTTATNNPSTNCTIVHGTGPQHPPHRRQPRRDAHPHLHRIAHATTSPSRYRSTAPVSLAARPLCAGRQSDRTREERRQRPQYSGLQGTPGRPLHARHPRTPP